MRALRLGYPDLTPGMNIHEHMCDDLEVAEVTKLIDCM